jgi:hypothetical protein
MKFFKYSFILGLSILLAISCQTAVPEPALSDQIIGNYTVSSYNVNGITVNLPATNATGTTATARIITSKVDEQSVNVTFVFTQTKSGISNSSNSKLENVQLKRSNNTKIEGFEEGLKALEMENGFLTLIFNEPDPKKNMIINAVKENK